MLQVVLFTSLFGLTALERPACTVMLTWFERPAHTDYVVLRATPDSISDGTYYQGIPGISREPIRYARPVPVFGQVFQVITANGVHAESISAHGQAVVVWWGLGPSCQRMPPHRVGTLEAGAELLLPARPREPSDLINGMPT
jgi:hypothetical protein